jgi:hypothetical protein
MHDELELHVVSVPMLDTGRGACQSLAHTASSHPTPPREEYHAIRGPAS